MSQSEELAVNIDKNVGIEETTANLKFDPSGHNRDCRDFENQDEAQLFFIASGGPDQDQHQLDGNDNDGIVCESLP
ncbi:hypothetical protein ACSVDA_19590 [Cytobacillus sp. Hm23]